MEKKQVVDANFCRGVSARREKAICGCIFCVGVSARQRKSSLRMQIFAN